MRAYPFIVFTGLSFLITTSAFAVSTLPSGQNNNPVVAAPPQASVASPEIKALATAATAKYPLFSILSEERPNFRKNWENKMALGQIMAANTLDEQFAVTTGATLALDETPVYLSRTDDASANAFGAAFGMLIDIGVKDATVCKVMLPGTKNSVSAQDQERMEKRFGPLFLEKLLPAMTMVVLNGRKGEPNLLSKDDFQSALVPMILNMAKIHGPDTIDRLTRLDSPDDTNPAEKCETIGWMMAAILDLPEHDRAMIFRTMYSK